MANLFVDGSDFALLLTISGTEVELVCKSASTINFTNTSIEVRNRCTGEYSERVAGGQKSGSIDFSGDYNKTPTAPNITAFDIAQQLGNIVPAVWGGTSPGDEIVTVDVQVNNVSSVKKLYTSENFRAISTSTLSSGGVRPLVNSAATRSRGATCTTPWF